MEHHCCPIDDRSRVGHALPTRQLAQLARALADETRLEILTLLVEQNQPICVCHLVERVPVGQPTVSHHLRLLRQAGLVTVERRGTWAYYQATPLARLLLERLSEAIHWPVMA
ncbi:ArsR/SmtB family transcription factor [Thermomicrobium roseum]|jgi:ArsR family transcriptional regulator|uniref:Putative arsenic-efflux pump regulatory protein n=1 Tax=Thermomicrobium roseum (strain ATCC 27502 / DSM 5159 / P-2) TaxID=309801 RepID=B9L293_THERP|nr:metalloregulator ArsR/SmtB family transcription factor [Thermomicrobium roseum]ACM06312.1 putative arsenic-efflux pump regulatory protein [Thermomicrobium roseum DSM 5159]MBO9384957.1 winged helix-turn-helix transcriptional regulator [Thermomicrobium sp.]